MSMGVQVGQRVMGIAYKKSTPPTRNLAACAQGMAHPVQPIPGVLSFHTGLELVLQLGAGKTQATVVRLMDSEGLPE